MEPPRVLLATLWNHPDERLTEPEISLLWTYFLPVLERIDAGGGPSIRIRDKGEPVPGQGPDLEKVRLLVDGVRRTGSVEIHRHSYDWYRHNHHRDPAYNTVILHVCLRRGPAKTRRQDGQLIPVVSLIPHLEEFRQRARQAIGPSLEERLRTVKRPCFGPSPADRKRYRRVLESSARSWLACRAAKMRKQPKHRVVFQGLVESLGYGGNHDTFRRLARRLAIEDVHESLDSATTTHQVEGYLMGVGGWLPRPFRGGVNRIIYRRRRRWESTWKHERERIRDPSAWNRCRVRPQAFPLRRWICFGWATRRINDSWQGRVNERLRPLLRESSLRAPLRRKVLRPLKFPRGNYWRHHYTRCDAYRDAVASPFGTSWVDQMVVNVLFPFWYLQSLRRGDEAMRKRVWEHFFSYPPTMSNRRTRRVLRQWGLEGRFTWSSVAEQQGAVHLLKRGCSEARCERCPLGGRPDPTKKLEVKN